MGVFGALYPTPRFRVTYEIYAVNGLHSGFLEESDSGTRIFAGKGNIEDNNNSLALAGRIGLSPAPQAEVGFSWHSGYYNETMAEDLVIGDARNARILALD